MSIEIKVHQIQMNYKISEDKKRFVNIYLITGEKCYLIDAGVFGAETAVLDYMKGIGREITEIAGIFLTNGGPDHIGGAAAIQRLSGCKIYAGEEEIEWMMDLEKQFQERPFANFHELVKEPIKPDVIIKDQDLLEIEDEITLEVLDTRGYSNGSKCYYLPEKRVLFTGNAIPALGEAPIYNSVPDMLKSLRVIHDYPDVDCYLPSWDNLRPKNAEQEVIQKAHALVFAIDQSVKQAVSEFPDKTRDEIFDYICEQVHATPYAKNSLFKRSIMTSIDSL